MSDISPVVERHREAIKQLARERGIMNVRVYGSMARGDDGPDSDIDLLVRLGEDASYMDLGGFLTRVSELTKRRVDVAEDDRLHPKMAAGILEDCVPL